MHKFAGYCCWIKLTDPKKAVPVLRLPEHLNKSINRPPPQLAGFLAFGGKGKHANEDLGDDLPTNANAQMAGIELTWGVDSAYCGDPIRRPIDYFVFPGGRADAYEWIASPDGTHWLENAAHFFMMEFGLQSQEFVDPQKTPFPAGRNPPGALKRWSTVSHLQWDPEFKRHLYRNSRFTQRNWLTMDIARDLRSLLPETFDVDAALVGVDRKASSLFASHKVCAESEHYDLWRAMMPILQACGRADLFEKKLTSTVGLVGLLLEETLPPLAYYKQLFDVARPEHHELEGIPFKPLLAPTPRHPSFPSGHSCQAWLVALVLGRGLAETVQTAMQTAAQSVAERRVIGGLHFDVDAEAGKRLASHLYSLLFDGDNSVYKKDKGFARLVDQCADELLSGLPIDGGKFPDLSEVAPPTFPGNLAECAKAVL